MEYIRQQLRARLEGEEVEVRTRRVLASNTWEVEVGGRTVHSRKRGDGFVDTPGKIDKIVRALLAERDCSMKN